MHIFESKETIRASQEQFEIALKWMESGQKIHAIKEIRAAARPGNIHSLKDCKNFLEEVWAKHSGDTIASDEATATVEHVLYEFRAMHRPSNEGPSLGDILAEALRPSRDNFNAAINKIRKDVYGY